MPKFIPNDRSGNLATSGLVAELLALDPHRRGWRLMNNSTADIWFNDVGGVPAVGASGSYKIEPGDMYESPINQTPQGPVSIISTAASQAYSAAEW